RRPERLLRRRGQRRFPWQATTARVEPIGGVGRERHVAGTRPADESGRRRALRASAPRGHSSPSMTRPADRWSVCGPSDHGPPGSGMAAGGYALPQVSGHVRAIAEARGMGLTELRHLGRTGPLTWGFVGGLTLSKAAGDSRQSGLDRVIGPTLV